MMDLAGYAKEAQRRSLLFYFLYIAPSLGRRTSRGGQPTGWKSFMTDDPTPVELSWD